MKARLRWFGHVWTKHAEYVAASIRKRGRSQWRFMEWMNMDMQRAAVTGKLC